MPIDDLRSTGFHTVGVVTINGVRLRAMFDTGAAATILSSSAAFHAGLRRDMPGAQPGDTTYGFGSRSIETWIAPVASLKIGDEELRNSRVRVGDIGAVDMLIGADFFISHRVFVSNALHTLFFSYTGGPIFNLGAHRQGDPSGVAAAPAADGAEPRTPAEFSRRGAVAAARNDYVHAIADFSRAIADAPNEPHYLRQRAEAYADSHQENKAAADIDRMIDLAPADVWARLVRARFRLAHDLKPGAKADLDVATAAAAPASDDRFAIADLYQGADAPEQAIAELDRWIPNHPADARRPEALNNRCWLRATLGRDLAQALADCNEALRLRPRRASYLDSRGLVRLRMGDLARAIDDYDAALALVPRLAWSLYGRGTARLAQGKVAAGNADIAAAVAIDGGIIGNARKYGIGGSGSDGSPDRPHP
jgi:tetratricopeptide (TPR) repeat protein